MVILPISLTAACTIRGSIMSGKSQFGRCYTLRLLTAFPIQIYTSILSTWLLRDVGWLVFFHKSSSPTLLTPFRTRVRAIPRLIIHINISTPHLASLSKKQPPLHPYHALMHPSLPAAPRATFAYSRRPRDTARLPAQTKRISGSLRGRGP